MRVAHIVPSMNIGGVEVAIYRSASSLSKVFDYNVYCVKEKGTLDCGQESLIRYFRSLFSLSDRADVVVTSLWWSHPIGFLSTFFGVRWVVFLHSSGYASVFDWMFTKAALKLARTFFVDSVKTQDSILAKESAEIFFVPFLTVEANYNDESSECRSTDISWAGRNSPEKRLDLLATVCRGVLRKRPSTKVRLSVSGVASAELNGLAHEFPHSVTLKYNDEPDAVLSVFARSNICLCLSDYEGFSMATAEAALLGNLICSRKVGELESYLPRDHTIWLEAVDRPKLDNLINELNDILNAPKLLKKKQMYSKKHVIKALEGKSYIKGFVKAIKGLKIGHD